MMSPITTALASANDADRLADIRVEAMRPSLQAAGRFDRDRARGRFLVAFRPEDTRLILAAGVVIGFVVVRHRDDHMYLDQLCVSPAHQGGGAGRYIVRMIQDEARSEGLPLRLMALNVSRANAFYVSCGFRALSSDALDTQYEWRPDAP